MDKNFCSNCGKELNGEKFCPNCGTNTENVSKPSIAENFQFNSKESKLNLWYLAFMILPVVYIILLLRNWFEISIPYIGTSQYHIYDLYKSVSSLFDYVDAGGVKALFIIFYILLLLFAVSAVIMCAESIKKAFKHDRGCVSSFSNASILSIITSVFVMAAIFFIQLLIKGAMDSYGMGGFGNAVSNIIGLTSTPTSLLVLSVILKILTGKAEYEIWNLEK